MTRLGFTSRLRQSHENQRLNTVMRRNGKPQSCEPCRKGKLKCDHMLPTCGRCRRRNRAEQCLYHPAPLTKARAASPSRTISVSSEGEGRTSPKVAANSPNGFSYQQTTTTIANSNSSNDWRSPPHATREPPYAGPPRTTGFMGPTSLSALLAENATHVDIHMANMEVPSGLTPASESVQKGAAVLSLLKDLPYFERCIDRWFSLYEGVVVIKPMAKQWTQGIWECHRAVLQFSKPEELLALSELVWRNTQRPLQFNGSTTPREWTALSTGQGLRWEVVGIVFCLVGLLAVSLLDGDIIFYKEGEEPIDRHALAATASKISEECIGFCRELDILNDLFCWLLYENLVLASGLMGRASHIVWQKSGELNNILIALGLHQEITVDDQTPFFLSEFRKKTFVCAYASDKTTAAFLGRPPRLSYRYCLLQLPLDLDDTQIMCDGPQLEAALATLDEDGWNKHRTAANLMRCTCARIWCQNAKIREDILELSLGVQQQDIEARAEQIQGEVDRVWRELPAFLRRAGSEFDRRAPAESIFLNFIRLEHLSHTFHLQRLLVRKAGADRRRLIETSREMFQHFLVLVNNRDTLRDFQLDIMTIASTHASPCCVTLAIELLWQENRGYGPSGDPHAPPLLPRSETIQDLSVFVAFLDTVKRTDSGCVPFQQTRTIVKHILDRILSPPAPISPPSSDPTAPVVAGAEMEAATEADAMGALPPAQMSDADFMTWLDNMNWDREPWGAAAVSEVPGWICG